jgi:hypothetical protein
MIANFKVESDTCNKSEDWRILACSNGGIIAPIGLRYYNILHINREKIKPRFFHIENKKGIELILVSFNSLSLFRSQGLLV